jgi:EAL domain-containing protein (putative c-di-GMP-specific phosphodiesterase class I)
MQAVGSMAHNLGLVVVAAGVETPEERYLIASLGCDRAQGMLIGKPVSWSEIRATPVAATAATMIT